jgi:hypothetical protein
MKRYFGWEASVFDMGWRFLVSLIVCPILAALTTLSLGFFKGTLLANDFLNWLWKDSSE